MPCRALVGFVVASASGVLVGSGLAALAHAPETIRASAA